MKPSVVHLLAGIAWVILPLGYVAPKGEAALFTLAAVLALLLLARDRALLPIRPGWLLPAAAACGALALVSAAWSLTPARSLQTGIITVATGLGVAVLAKGAAAMTGAQAQRLEQVVLVAMGAGLVWLAADELSGGLISSAMVMLKNSSVSAGQDPRSYLNNGVSVAALLAWPWCMALARRFGLAAACAGMAALAGAIYFGMIDTAPLALLIGMAAAGVTAVLPRLARGAAIAGVVVMTMGMPLLPGALPDPLVDDPLTARLSNSGLHRLVIWRNAVAVIESRPWLGHGFDTSRALYGPETRQVYRLSGRDFTINVEPIPLHPHNATLQVWIELGGVGAGLCAILLAVLVGRIFDRVADRITRAAAVGMLATATVIAHLSYGAWQSWWLGSLGLAAVFMVAAVRAADGDGRPEGQL